MADICVAAIDNAISNGQMGQVQYRVIALCALLLVFDGYDIGTIGYALPALSRAWGLNPSDLTLAIVFSGVGMLVGSMISGPLGDLRGRKPVFIACVAIFGIFSIACAFTESPSSLSIMRFLTGLGLGGGVPTAIALTSDYVPRRNRPIIVGMMTGAVPVGLLLGGLTSSLLIPTYGWQAIFLVGGVLPLALLPLLVGLLPESIQMLLATGAPSRRTLVLLKEMGIDAALADLTPANVTSPPAAKNPVSRLFREGYATRTLLLWTMFFCNFLATWLVIFWLPTILSATGASDSDAAFYSALLPMGGLAGVAVIALLARRGRIERILALALLLGTAAAFLMWVLRLSPQSAAVIIFLVGAGLQGAQFGMNGLCGSVYPTAIRATGSGWAFGVGRIGNIIGPGLGGIVLGLSFPPKTMFLVAVGAALLASIALFLLGRERATGRLEV
jgi:AAHS family 4-hydroxybenzoate transporter-like MFS transporter